MKKRKILIVVGTRPNIIKVTQFKKNQLRYPNLEFKIVHTGQHYNEEMSTLFFKQLRVEPDFFLNISKSSANNQIAQILIGLENVCKEYAPDYIMAVGDVNSTLAAALTANKLNIGLMHLESGLRSFDRSMPEEINRIITDELSNVYFVTEQSGYDNLIKENRPAKNIFMVGNTMIDTLVAFDSEIKTSGILNDLNLVGYDYVVATMHRPSNVDSMEGLDRIVALLNYFSKDFKVVFPVHPRTLKRLKEFDLFEQLNTNKSIVLSEPKDYFSFQHLVANCAFVITDSGGIQEETTFRKIPCFTIRPNTERPVTIVEGTNVLIPSDDVDTIIKSISENLNKKKGKIPVLWDGKATERIVDIIGREL